MSDHESNDEPNDHISTALEIEDNEDNIEKVHERKSLLSRGRKKVKSPSCRTMFGKVVCISIAGILFILMMVEIWQDYGRIVDTKTLFPPKIYSITETCRQEENTTLTKQYNPLTCTWETNNATKIHCTGNMPSFPLVLPYMQSTPDMLNISGNHICMEWYKKQIESCLRVIVWSI